MKILATSTSIRVASAALCCLWLFPSAHAQLATCNGKSFSVQYYRSDYTHYFACSILYILYTLYCISTARSHHRLIVCFYSILLFYILDGDLDAGEICDGTVFSEASNSCEKFGYIGGTIGCTDKCTADLTKCEPGICGDNLIATAINEQCGTFPFV
jgi:hypothetical protein